MTACMIRSECADQKTKKNKSEIGVIGTQSDEAEQLVSRHRCYEGLPLVRSDLSDKADPAAVGRKAWVFYILSCRIRSGLGPRRKVEHGYVLESAASRPIGAISFRPARIGRAFHNSRTVSMTRTPPAQRFHVHIEMVLGPFAIGIAAIRQAQARRKRHRPDLYRFHRVLVLSLLGIERKRSPFAALYSSFEPAADCWPFRTGVEVRGSGGAVMCSPAESIGRAQKFISTRVRVNTSFPAAKEAPSSPAGSS